MLNRFLVRPAALDDEDSAAFLVQLSMRPADSLLGGGESPLASCVLRQLFRHPHNAFSHQYMDVAVIGGQVAGLLLSYPAQQASELLQATPWQILRSVPMWRAPQVAWHVRHLHRLMPNPATGEYCMRHIAVLPGFQGKGVGRKLLELAEDKASTSGASACAIDVLVENAGAIRLYQRSGYQAAHTFTPPWLAEHTRLSGYHHMVKPLPVVPPRLQAPKFTILKVETPQQRAAA